MSELLLEIGTEEIPAWMIPGAQGELKSRFREALGRHGLEEGVSVSVEATPRRLVLFASGLRERQEDRVEILRGPAHKVAFDAAGNPTKAALGFSKKAGVSVEELAKDDDGKLTARREIAGRTAMDLLSESLPQVVVGIRFPKSMYWTGKGGPRFVRPIRWLLALLDGQVVPFEIAGVASSNSTKGHRRLGRGEFTVVDADEYRHLLASNAVILAAKDRCEKIVSESTALLPAGCCIRSNVRLLETLVFETEYPSAVLGSFDEVFLRLPEEVLETVMLVHQKYFVVEDDQGNMQNSFMAVANLDADPDGQIRRGHERVIRARFSDAQFFWNFDQKRSLTARVDDLKSVVFQAALGSYWDKTVNNLRAVAALGEGIQLDQKSVQHSQRAMHLAKCDLTTEMVGEFPELQGKIGGLYAVSQGEPSEVADAIYDHYLPVGATGTIPRTQVGCLVSMADKLTTLGGMFGEGLMPTGSRDPLALRRAAYSVIRVIVEKELPLSLSQLVTIAEAGSHEAELREFLVERLRHWLQESGEFTNDLVQAVLEASSEVPVDVVARCKACAEMQQTPDFESLTLSFKRIRNILTQAGELEAFAQNATDPTLLEAGAEVDLYDTLQGVVKKIAVHNAKREYVNSLREIAILRPTLDRYFDEILVMAEDETIRNNRLSFLAGMLDQLSTIADFTLIAAGTTAASGH